MDPLASESEALAFAQQAQQVLAQLHAQLGPEDYRLVQQLLHLEELATVAACAAAEERLLAALLDRHPDQAPAWESTIAELREANAASDTLPRRRARRAGT
jgi:hypothetical protein